MFTGLPYISAAGTVTAGQALAPINATAVTANVNDTNLIIFNSTYDSVIGVSGNHAALQAGTYVISGMYLAANQ